ncbi:MAG TPA: HDOD domain-containing protein, partial [Planctomycetota bacterium]|nr:HDOD domain-containing protein [Planctomycetota bacterium]
MPITRASLRDIVDRVHTVPTLPEVAMEVNRLLSDPTADANDVVLLVQRDPAMAAKMLRMVN